MKTWIFFSLFLHSALLSAESLSDRLAGFAKLNESRASFVETWSADYLSEPLVSKGTLEYKRPSQLSKFITDPEPIEQRIEGKRLSVIHDGETRSIQLSEQPELATGIYALQAMLDGDEDSLIKRFETKYSEITGGWTLSLTPKDRQVVDSIKLIVLEGKENQILQLNIQFYNGDNLLTEIVHED